MNIFRKSNAGLVFLSTVVGIANLIAVVLFWNLIKKGEHFINQQFDFVQFLTYQSHQNTVLQLYLVLFSIGIAILAFLGFSQIQRSTEEKAIKKAEEVSKRMVEKFIEESKSFNLGKTSYSNQYGEKSHEE